MLYSDPYLLERILRNLVSNAIRYTASGQVRLLSQIAQNTLKLEVVDTGVGISAENMQRIFEEYYQIDNPQRDRRMGLGLGLAIVRRMEALLGYKVEATSEPGRGSVFSFSVSLGDAAQVTQAFASNATSHDLNGVAVALVEDDPEIRHAVAGLMTQWGCQVTAGALPDEVVGSMEVDNFRPDILVCDYRLPQGLTALDVLSLVRKKWGAGMPALVLTGDTAPQVLHEIQSSGALLLHKPITAARLRAIMYLALNRDS